MGLNVTYSSMGWLGAASLGGRMMASHSFSAFGRLTLAVTILSTVLALVSRR